jgi:hypothetical protein
MILDLAACEWFKLSIVTEPATTPTDWEASVDDGVTWEQAQAVDAVSGWLIAGPAYTGGASPDFTVAAGDTRVKVRLVAAPETVIHTGGWVTAADL